jgi:hypothetical protein
MASSLPRHRTRQRPHGDRRITRILIAVHTNHTRSIRPCHTAHCAHVGDHETPQVGGVGDQVIPHPAVT